MSKKHHTTTDFSETPDILERLKEHPIFDWVVNNTRYLPFIFIALIATIAIGFKFSASRAAKAESNYLLAENYFRRLYKAAPGEQGINGKEEALRKLQEITNKHPELQSRYDGLIAQFLLIEGKEGEAALYAERAINRTKKENLEPYTQFSQATLLMARGQYGEALAMSQKLKKEMLDEMGEEQSLRDFGNALFAYNLLRIAMLQKELGKAQEELDAWKEWKQYSAESPQNAEAKSFAFIEQNMQEGSFYLNDYMNRREKILAKELQK